MNKHIKDNKGLLDLLKGSQGGEVYTTDYGSVKEFYLSSEIGEADEYVSWFHDIRNSRSSDIIKIHINCPGGNLFTTIQFLQALADCEARIVASVEGACMSAATLIFLCADEFQITNHSMFLFHNYSSATAGKGGEMYHGMVHERKWSEALLRDIYEDFLTEAEISDLINDKDIWMEAAEVLLRLEKRGKTVEKKTKAARKTAEKHAANTETE
jgi:hypothetical protein